MWLRLTGPGQQLLHGAGSDASSRVVQSRCHPTSGQLPPNLAQLDRAHVGLTDAEPQSNLSLCPTGCVNLTDLTRSQLCSSADISPLIHHVSGVIRWCTEKEMTRATTPSVVTPVTDKEASGDRTICKYEGKAVRFNPLAIQIELPVTIATLSRQPRPTAGRIRVAIDLAPEVSYQFCACPHVVTSTSLVWVVGWFGGPHNRSRS